MAICLACGAEFLPNCLRCSMCGAPKGWKPSVPVEEAPAPAVQPTPVEETPPVVMPQPETPMAVQEENTIVLMPEENTVAPETAAQPPSDAQSLDDIWQPAEDASEFTYLFRPRLSVKEIIRRHSGLFPLQEADIRIGNTVYGGAYAVCYRSPGYSEIVEYDEYGREVYCLPNHRF